MWWALSGRGVGFRCLETSGLPGCCFGVREWGGRVGIAPSECSHFKVPDKNGSGASGVPVAPADGSGAREYGGYCLLSGKLKVCGKCGFGASGFPVAPIDGSGVREYGG